MKRIVFWATVGAILSATGCGSDPYKAYELGEARDVVAGSVESAGGIDRWLSAGPISTDAVVTTYDEAAVPYANRQELTIDLDAGVIHARARDAVGAWTARATAGGKSDFDADGFVPPAGMAARTTAALRMILHGVRGPLNMLGHGERAAGAQRVRLEGMDLVRVPVTGSDAAAYYFDAATRELRLVTAGADSPGGEGTVTVYTYEELDNGMLFPARICVRKIGRHVLIGEEPVLEVDFQDVRF